MILKMHLHFKEEKEDITYLDGQMTEFLMSLFKIFILPSLVFFETQEIYSPVSFNEKTIFTFLISKNIKRICVMSLFKSAISNDNKQLPL